MTRKRPVVGLALIKVLIAVLVGLCLIPIGLLLELAAIAYGCYAAYICSLHQEFRYPIIWEMITTE